MSQGGRGVKTISDLLQDKITAFISRPNHENKTYQSEFAQLQIENDMVNTFFDEIHKMSDHFTFNFVESLKQELDTIMAVIQQSATEQATCFTLLTLMLRRLSPIDGAFANTLLLCK